MSESQDTRSPEDIQRDIQRTRAEMSQTLDAISDKLSPGEILDQALNFFKSSGSGSKGDGIGAAAGHWAENLGESIKQNPVPVALIGAGIAWLALGGSSRSTRSTHRVHAYETASSESPYGQDHSGGVRERASELASGMRERVGEVASGARDQISAAGERVGDTADRLRHRAREQGGQVAETFTYLRDEQPLVLGALGFALGAALGAGLPSTEREDELMGEARDQVVQRAQEIGEEQIDKAKQVASAAGEAALNQAEQEGLTQDSADQTLRQATEKVEHVVKASVDAVKKEVEPQTSPSESLSPGARS